MEEQENLPEQHDITDLLKQIKKTMENPTASIYEEHMDAWKAKDDAIDAVPYGDVPDFWKDQAVALLSRLHMKGYQINAIAKNEHGEVEMMNENIKRVARFLYHQYDNLLH